MEGKSYDKITEFCAFPMFVSFKERGYVIAYIIASMNDSTIKPRNIHFHDTL